MHRRHRVTDPKNTKMEASLHEFLWIQMSNTEKPVKEKDKKKGGQLVPRSFCVEEGGL